MGPLDRPDRCAPHDRGNRARPLLHGHEIGGDIAAELPAPFAKPANALPASSSGSEAATTPLNAMAAPRIADDDAEQHSGAPADAEHEEGEERGRGRRAEGAGRRRKPARAALPAISAAASVPAVTAAM